MQEEYSFLTKAEKAEYIEKEANLSIKTGKVPIVSNVYIGVELSDLDTKERIFNVLNTDGLTYSIETYNNDTFYNITTSFPELTKGEKFVEFIEKNFPNVSIELDVLEERANRFRCPTCGEIFSDIVDALYCHYEDCEELLKEMNKEFNLYLKEEK